jgi:hypothetical protein
VVYEWIFMPVKSKCLSSDACPPLAAEEHYREIYEDIDHHSKNEVRFLGVYGFLGFWSSLGFCYRVKTFFWLFRVHGLEACRGIKDCRVDTM